MTKKTLLATIGIFGMFFFITCQKEKIKPRDYPRIDFVTVDQSGERIVFRAEILTQGNSEITKKGFEWWPISFSGEVYPKISLDSANDIGLFEPSPTYDLVKEKQYAVRAFAKTDEKTVYSIQDTFLCKYNSEQPIIDDFYPKEGKWDDTLKIKGSNLSFIESNLDVYFGDVRANIVSCSNTLISVFIPDVQNDTIANVSLRVYNNNLTFDETFKYINPKIFDYYPKSGTFADTITIIGESLPQNAYYIDVIFNETAIHVVDNDRSFIKIIVPNEIETPESTLRVDALGVSMAFEENFILNPPVISGIFPDTVYDLETIINVEGKNFNSLNNYNSLNIGNYQASIISAESDLLQAKISSNNIPNLNITHFDTLSVSLTVAQQSCSASEKIYLKYYSTWTEKENLTGNGRAFAISHVINGKGYYGLGAATNYQQHDDFWQYNPDLDKWTQKSSFPATAAGESASFVIGDKIYVCCGMINDKSIKDVWVYNTETDSWTQKKDFPGEARYQAFGFSHNGKGYVGSGITEKFGTILNDLWEYDPLADSWNKKNDIPHLCGENYYKGIQAITVDNMVYVLGHQGEQYTRDFWKYNSETDTWLELADMPRVYYNTAVSSIENTIYVTTGKYASNSDCFYKYDIDSDTWHSMEEFAGRRRHGASSFSFNDWFYILDGYNYSDIIKDMWMYDPSY